MPLDLANYEIKAKEAVKAFWGNRAAAVAKQKELGREDQGERAGVTAGKNMDGFIALIQDVIRANGLTDAHMMMGRRVLCLPGFFRPTKLWDLLIINERRLVAALELKSQERVAAQRRRHHYGCDGARALLRASRRSLGL
jgi:type II restriction enzyme